MKLNKFFFILLSVAVLAGFSSCGSDDDDYSAKDIEGRWTATGQKMTVNTNNGKATTLINALLLEMDGDVQWSYEFKANGTYSDWDYPSDPNPETGTYRVHGHKLYLKESGENVEDMYGISSLSKDKLNLSVSENANIALLTYLEDYLDLNEDDIEPLKALFVAAGVDIATVKLKSVRMDVTLTKVASPR